MQAMVNRHSRGVSMAPGRDFAQVTGRAFCGLALLAVSAAMAPSTVAAAAALAGEWSGEGTVTQTEGPTEKVRCRVSYKQESAKVFGVEAKCASTSQMMTQTGELLEVRPGVFTGKFNLTQYDIAGRVRVELDGESQTVTFKSPKGEGEVILTRR